MPEARFADFSGGMTDHYLNGAQNKFRYGRNIIITRNRKPKQRPGSVVRYDTTIPQGAQRISRMYYDDVTVFDNKLYAQSGRALNVEDGSGGLVEIQGPSSNAAYGAGDINSVGHFDYWKNHIITNVDEYASVQKVYEDESGDTKIVNISLPEVDGSSISVTPLSPGSDSYLYAFVYYFEYMVGTVKYADFSRVFVFGDAVTSNPIGPNTVAITGLPSIPSLATENYDVSNIKLQVYRTQANQTSFQYVGEIAANSSSTFNDSVADGDLGLDLYINGGLVNPNEAPRCKYFTIANGICWYANVLEGTEKQDFRVRHSFQGDIDQVPGSYFVDVEGPITGISNVDIYPIVFERKRTYRLEGLVDRLGRGSVVRRDISNEVGCINHASIVRTVRGIYFCALDGIYFCDGFQVQKLSEHLNERFKQATSTASQKRKIIGGFDRITGRIYWTMQSGPGGNECDSMWVVDPHWGLTIESTFTEFADTDDPDNFRPTALAFIDGTLLRGDSRGYVFEHREDIYSDPKVDVNALTSEWSTKGVNYYLESNALSYGTEIGRKWMTQITTMYKNQTNISSQISSINDDSEQLRPLKEFRFRSNISWGDDDPLWSDSGAIWNFGGLIISTRRFPKKGLRCTYKQVVYQPSETIIDRSDVTGTATLSKPGGSAVLLLDQAASQNWPIDIVDYKVFFGDDNYETGYTITSRSDDTLILNDPDDSLTLGSKEWVIKGVRKNELFELESYSIKYDGYGESQTFFNSGDSGGNS